MQRIFNNVDAIISALILFYLVQPFFFWHGFLSTIYVKTLLSFILGGFFWLNRKKLSEFEFFLFALLLVTLILYLITSGRNINFFLTILPVLFIPFSKDEYKKKVLDSFIFIYALLVGLSLVVWLLGIFGVVHPYKTIPPLNTLKPYDYNVYPFLVSPAGQPILRFCGPFDEPGLVGTLSGILLCIKKIDLKNRASVVFLLSGLCSLSLFFYVLVSVYFIVYYIAQKRSYGKALFFALTLVLAFFIIQSNSLLQERIGTRITWDTENNQLAGDNRINTDIVEDVFYSIVGTREFWFGVEDKQDYLEIVQGSSSFYNVIIVNGVVFTTLYLIFFVLYGFYYKNSIYSFILFLLVFLGTIYQRPSTFHMTYVFLFVSLAQMRELEHRPINHGPITNGTK